MQIYLQKHQNKQKRNPKALIKILNELLYLKRNSKHNMTKLLS